MAATAGVLRRNRDVEGESRLRSYFYVGDSKMSCSRQWINTVWYIQTTEYYIVLKINELSSQEKTWRKLKYTILNEEGILKRPHAIILTI